MRRVTDSTIRMYARVYKNNVEGLKDSLLSDTDKERVIAEIERQKK